MFNGNDSLVADKCRGIAYITYDFNNTPRQIYFTNGRGDRYLIESGYLYCFLFIFWLILYLLERMPS